MYKEKSIDRPIIVIMKCHTIKLPCLLSTVLMALSLNGCATFSTPTTPDLNSFHPPENIALPSAWSVIPAQATLTPAGQASSPLPWWQSVDDPLLKSLIESAIKSSPDVRQALIRVAQSRTSEESTQSGFFPTISGSLSTSRSAASGQSLTTVENNYKSGFDASWELPLWSGQIQNANAAAFDIWAKSLDLRQAQVTLIAEVASQYITVRAAQWQYHTTKQNLSKQEESLSLTEFQAQAGLVNQLAVEQARANVAQARASIPDLQLAEHRAMRRLAVLSGLTPQALTAPLSFVGDTMRLPALPSTMWVAIPLDTLRQRPDVRSAEMTLLAEQSRTSARQWERLPSLRLGGSWSWQGLSLSALGGSASLVRTALASLTATIFDGGALKSRAQLQSLVADAALINYEKVLLVALEDMENRLDSIVQSRLKIAALTEANRATINANDLARAQYQVGLTSFTTMLDSDRNRLTSDNALVQAHADQWLAIIALYKAMGGDWQNQ
jgi:NodT family efflux transporter outer membrane factor (OMF) lipoprotein